jgi:pimeloyl-ACP methyl ester carboxylesterase
MNEAPRRHRIPLSRGGAVDVWDAGPREAPTLVLIPGVAGAKEIFAKSLADLAEGRRVLAVDLSPHVPRLALDAAAEDLWEALDGLGAGAVDLLGQSFGAVVAVRALRLRPHAVRRLILVAPASVPAPREAARVLSRWALLSGTLRLWPSRGRAAAVRWIERRGGYVLEPALSAEDLDALFERVKRTPIRPLLRRLLALRGHSWVRELAEVRVPVLVIEGDREWRILPREVRACFEARTATRLALLPGGHMPFLTNPREFGALVRAFLADDHS